MTARQRSLQRRSGAPALHRQLTRELRGRISAGEFAPGDRLPSEYALAAGYGVSRHVVRQALSQLVAQGQLQARHGAGYFVNGRRLRRDLPSLTSFTKSMAQLGSVRTKVVRQELVAAGAAIASGLDEPFDDRAVCVERVGYLNDEPVALLTGYFPLPLGAVLLDRDLENRSVYELLEEETGTVAERAEAIVSVAFASYEEASLLDVPEGSALLCLQDSTWSTEDTLMELSRGRYRSDRFEFSIQKR